MVPGNIQMISSTNENSRCRNCGADLSEFGAFKYSGDSFDVPKYRLEKNACIGCGKQFLIRYNLFENGHVLQKAFDGDINDATYQWESLWSKEQVETVRKHVADCKECQSKADVAILSDAVFASLIHGFEPVSNRG